MPGFLFFLLLLLSSCSMEKRLYRPGWYIDRGHEASVSRKKNNSIPIAQTKKEDILHAHSIQTEAGLRTLCSIPVKSDDTIQSSGIQESLAYAGAPPAQNGCPDHRSGIGQNSGGAKAEMKSVKEIRPESLGRKINPNLLFLLSFLVFASLVIPVLVILLGGWWIAAGLGIALGIYLLNWSLFETGEEYESGEKNFWLNAAVFFQLAIFIILFPFTLLAVLLIWLLLVINGGE